MALDLCLRASGQCVKDGLWCLQVPHHAIQNVSFNWDDHDKFLPGDYPYGLSIMNCSFSPHCAVPQHPVNSPHTLKSCRQVSLMIA